MHSHDIQTPSFPTSPVHAFGDTSSAFSTMPGAISEIAYHQDQLWVTQCILLPLLQQLGQQSRWQLWLTPCKQLSRAWLRTTGLPLDKVMQSKQPSSLTTLDAMEKALRTGNYSVVIGWLEQPLNTEAHQRLSAAASVGQSLGFIMRPMQPMDSNRVRQHNASKIHSSLYH